MAIILNRERESRHSGPECRGISRRKAPPPLDAAPRPSPPRDVRSDYCHTKWIIPRASLGLLIRSNNENVHNRLPRHARHTQKRLWSFRWSRRFQANTGRALIAGNCPAPSTTERRVVATANASKANAIATPCTLVWPVNCLPALLPAPTTGPVCCT